MGAKEKALELMERDPVLYMDMLGPFHRGMTEIVAQSEEGLLLYNAPGRAYMLAADTPGRGGGPVRRGGVHGHRHRPQPGGRGVPAGPFRPAGPAALHPGGLPGLHPSALEGRWRSGS